jgi:hypothetical protein
MTNCFCDVARFFRIERAGLSFSDGAEATVASANIAAEHESRRPIGPTLEDVWTTCFLADSVQVETFDQLEHLVLVGRIAQTDAKPFRFGLTDFLVVADYT